MNTWLLYELRDNTLERGRGLCNDIQDMVNTLKSVTNNGNVCLSHQDSWMHESERGSGLFTVMANRHRGILLPLYSTDNFYFDSKVFR